MEKERAVSAPLANRGSHGGLFLFKISSLKNTSQVGSETIVNFIYNLSNIASSKTASLQQPYHKQEVMNGVKTM